MRILITITFILFSFLHNVNSQNIEYLEKKLSSVSSWQEEVDIYLSIVDTLTWLGGNPEKNKIYTDKIIEICKSNSCQEQVIIARAYLASKEIELGNYSSIDNFILPTIEKNKSFSPETKSLLYEVAGSYYLINGKGNEAISHFLVAQNILEEKNPGSKRLGKIYYEAGFAHNINGNNNKSVDYLQKSIDHFTLTKDTTLIINANSGMSTLLATDGKYNQAIQIILESIELAESKDISTFNLYSSLLDVYIRNGNYEAAEKSYHKGIKELYAVNIPLEEKAIDLWSFHMSYAKLLGRINRPTEGLRYVDSSYVYSGYINDFTDRITDLRRAGLLVKSEKYELAELEVNELFEKMKNNGNLDAFNSAVIGLFSTIYSKSSLEPKRELVRDIMPIVDRIILKNENEYNLDVLDAEKLSAVLGIYTLDKERSLQSFSKVLEIQDSLKQMEQIKSTNELLVQYDTKEKEKLIEIQKLELSKKAIERNYLIGLSFVSAFTIGILFLFYNQKKKYAGKLQEEVRNRTAELLKSNQELSQSKEELERYNYIASHDLKEPLRSVVSFVDFIKRKKLVEDEETLSYFGYIESGANQMNKIVQDLVTFSKLKKIEVTMQTINVSGIIEHIKHDLNYDLEMQSTVVQTKNIPNNIISDKSILYRVFKNLVENGLKFNENENPFVKIEYHNSDEHHVFEVSDNGIGIEAEYHEQIFGLFKRLNDRSKYSGSGVGLAICKKLLIQIDGDISLKNNLYEGTTFIIKIPQNKEVVKQEMLKQELFN